MSVYIQLEHGVKGLLYQAMQIVDETHPANIAPALVLEGGNITGSFKFLVRELERGGVK